MVYGTTNERDGCGMWYVYFLRLQNADISIGSSWGQ
jgi:hypothetical protein